MVFSATLYARAIFATQYISSKIESIFVAVPEWGKLHQKNSSVTFACIIAILLANNLFEDNTQKMARLKIRNDWALN